MIDPTRGFGFFRSPFRHSSFLYTQITAEFSISSHLQRLQRAQLRRQILHAPAPAPDIDIPPSSTSTTPIIHPPRRHQRRLAPVGTHHAQGSRALAVALIAVIPVLDPLCQHKAGPLVLLLCLVARGARCCRVGGGFADLFICWLCVREGGLCIVLCICGNGWDQGKEQRGSSIISSTNTHIFIYGKTYLDTPLVLLMRGLGLCTLRLLPLPHLRPPARARVRRLDDFCFGTASEMMRDATINGRQAPPLASIPSNAMQFTCAARQAALPQSGFG